MEQLAKRPRAARYEMTAPVMYRQAGDEAWHEGRTLNISSSGVLFAYRETVLAPGTRVEFVLVLPSLGPRTKVRVQCRGAIVRQERRGVPQPLCALAATIETYDFVAPNETEGVNA